MTIWMGICGVLLVGMVLVAFVGYLCVVAGAQADDRMDALKKQMNHEDV